MAILERLTASQASDPTALGVSVAAHAAHLAYHMEVVVRWEEGDRGPFDWKGSFTPGTVDDVGWTHLQARVQAAYAELLEMV